MSDDIYGGGYTDDSESVDDILAEILNSDGSFNRDFNSRFAAYLGEDASEFTSAVSYDLSDRSGERKPERRVEYEAPEYKKPHIIDDGYEEADRKLDEKLPPNVRNAYYTAESDAMRPEFTAGGSVKYPTMGSGASEQRVVYDADWEEKARKEAARLQRVREDRMLRGDSAYSNTFVAGGRRPEPRSPYVDPLSDDDDIYSPEFSRGAQDNKNPFFQSGPAVRRNNGSVNGRTKKPVPDTKPLTMDESIYDSFASSYEKTSAKASDWLEVEDKQKKKKEKKQRRRNKYADDEETQNGDDTMPPVEYNGMPEEPRNYRRDSFYAGEMPEMTLTQPRRRKKQPSPAEPVKHAMEQAQTENAELKNTVADIIEKYNRRSEEDAIARLKAEEERRIREEQAKADRERMRRGLSESLVKALDAEDESPEEFSGYDDFSEVKQEYSAPAIGSKPIVKKTENEYTERLDSEQFAAGIKNGFVFDDNFEEEEPQNTKKKKHKKKH